MSATFSKHEPLKPLHSLAFTGQAAYFAEVHSEEQLSELLQIAKRKNLPLLPLGEGTNMLFAQDFDGALLRVKLRGIRYLHADANYHYLQAAAGENWHDFVGYCLQEGYPGLENLSLIPGSVGAAPIQNIGAYGVGLSDFFVELEAYDLHKQQKQHFSATDCHFGYRDSLFKSKAQDRYLITSLTLRLPRRWQPKLHYPGLQEALHKQGTHHPSAQEVASAVIALRKSKLPDPTVLPNAGSFFKNPSLSATTFAALQAQHPQLRGYQEGNAIKVSAAALLEACGWKGYKKANIGVYEKHALVLVNYGQGRASDLKALADRMQNSVQERFGITLQKEVRII